MTRSARTTAPRRVTAETPSRVFPSSRDLRYGATSPLHSRGVPREALARHDLPERGPCQVALKGRRRSRAPAGRRARRRLPPYGELPSAAPRRAHPATVCLDTRDLTAATGPAPGP